MLFRFAFLTILAFLLFAVPANAGYYGYRFNWNPWHPYHYWHAPAPGYSNMYRWGFRREGGFGRCYSPYNCGWGG
jgi:hypothetical protein